MNKFLAFIFILALAAAFQLGAPSLALAQPVPDVEVQFQTAPLPLFDELDFLPGDSVTKWAKVTNNTSDSKMIVVKALNVSADSDFAGQFQFSVKKGGSTLTPADMTLGEFLTAGEVELNEVGAHSGPAQYDFTISMSTDVEDEAYQNKSLGFDLAIGFAGEELVPDTVVHGSGTGGSGQFEALRITHVRAENITFNTSNILWDTNYDASSQVVYSIDGTAHSFNDGQPNFGYGNTHPLSADENLVINHTVGLSGLVSCSKYYYVVISHRAGGLNTSSGEYSFTTLCPQVEGLSTEEEGLGGRSLGTGAGEEASGLTPEVEGASDEQLPPESGENGVSAKGVEGSETGLPDAIKDFCWDNFPWWAFLFFAAYPIWRGTRSRKEAKTAINIRLKNYLQNSARWWFASVIIPVALAIWALIKNPICLPWIWLILLLLATLIGWWYDRSRRNKLSSSQPL